MNTQYLLIDRTGFQKVRTAFVMVYQMVLNSFSVCLRFDLGLNFLVSELFNNQPYFTPSSAPFFIYQRPLITLILHSTDLLRGHNLYEFVSSVDAWYGFEWTHCFWFDLARFICIHWLAHNKWLLSVKWAMLLEPSMFWVLTQWRKASLPLVKHCSGFDKGNRWAWSSSAFCW